MDLANIPNSVQIPSGAPSDIQGLGLYLSLFGIVLNSWVAQVATVINGLAGYTFLVKPDNKLYVVSPAGTQTFIGNP